MMSLAPGVQLGPYEVHSLLGLGGMGEVYRAKDTRLNRDVALKVLTEAFTLDPDRLARFRREAQVLASLNHPNIGAIYGLEGSDGAQALVLELVEGPTLADRIAQGALPLDEALPIATQIAEALEAAHEQGIVHRDLKPANIKLRPDGTVKVLDFGLAKALEPTRAGTTSATVSPTITSPAMMTGVGVILGTAAYMAPEQAKGREADKRSDVWAFGCVLYEMLTGQRAFDGDDMTDVLGAVVRLEPKWEAMPADVPPAVRALVQRCLVKDRRARVSDIAAAKFVLTDAGGLLEPQAQTSASSLRKARWRSAAAIAAVASAAAAIGAVLAGNLRPATPTATVTRFSFMVPPAHGIAATRGPVAVSPDGLNFVYAGSRQLYVRSAPEWEARPISGTSIGNVPQNPVFSPDGTSLAFTAGQKIYSISVSGGTAAPICESGSTGITWHASGIVFGRQTPSPAGIFRCAPGAEAPERLATVGDDEMPVGPQILPGGRAMILTIFKANNAANRWDSAQVVLQSLTSRERRTLVNGSDGRFLPTGHLLYTVGGIVFAVPFDPERPQPLGNGVPVVNGVRLSLGRSIGAAFAVSDTGTLMYVPGPPEGLPSERLIMFADRDGRLTPLATPAGPYEHVRASRDGTRLVLGSDDGREANVSVLSDLSGANQPRRLTFGGRNRFPIWSPDDQRVTFQSNREGDVGIWEQRIDGTGLRRLTTPEPGTVHVPESWSPNGKHLSYSVQKDSEYSLWVLSVDDGKATRFGDVQSREPLGSMFSPDGGWIVYHSLPRGVGPFSQSAGVFAQAFPSGPVRQAPRVGRDSQPVWSRKGDELFYVGGTGGRLAAVRVDWTSALEFRTLQSLPGAIVGGRISAFPRAFDVMPDGRFVGLLGESAEEIEARGSAPREVRIVLNWFEDLKRLVPAK